jgi:hypothetical protein
MALVSIDVAGAISKRAVENGRIRAEYDAGRD